MLKAIKPIAFQPSKFPFKNKFQDDMALSQGPYELCAALSEVLLNPVIGV